MSRSTLSASILLLALLCLQISVPYGFASVLPSNTAHAMLSYAPLDTVLVGTEKRIELNATYTNPTYEVPITEPGAYRYNVSYYVHNGTHFLGIDLEQYLYESGRTYIPHWNNYLPNTKQFQYNSWWWETTGDSGGMVREFVAMESGTFSVEFYLTSRDPTDQVSVNFTVTQLYALADASSTILDQNHTLTWQQDHTYNATHLTILDDGLYNFTLYSDLPYDVTAGWPGNPTYFTFSKVDLISATHGEKFYFGSWIPFHNVTTGPATGIDTWTGTDLIKLPAGDYFLLGLINTFEFFNGSYASITLHVTRFSLPTLNANESLQLHFNANKTEAYVALVAPMGFEYSYYFTNPIGGNWSVECWDSDGWWIPSTLYYYANDTWSTSIEDRFQYGFVFPSQIGASTPSPGLLGDTYREEYILEGTDVLHNDGSPVGAIIVGLHPVSWFETFYLRIRAGGWAGLPSPEFNVTFNFMASPIPLLPLAGAVFSVNETIGPFYQLYQLPVASGHQYNISATATDYNTSGTVELGILPNPMTYLEWHWFTSPALSRTEPISGISNEVWAENETASLKYVPVQFATSYILIGGGNWVGFFGDTTEITVNMTFALPLPYATGTIANIDLEDMDFQSYSLQVLAGHSYRFDFNIGSTGDMAWAAFFNAQGFTPFVQSIIDLWVFAVAGSWNDTQTFTALQTEWITLVILGDGPISFSFTLIGEPTGSFLIGLAVGLIFMIIAIIIVFVIMRRRY